MRRPVLADFHDYCMEIQANYGIGVEVTYSAYNFGILEMVNIVVNEIVLLANDIRYFVIIVVIVVIVVIDEKID